MLKSNKKQKNIYMIFLLIATLFMGIGYAVVNSVVVNIDGNLVAEQQEGVFITEVNYVEDNNATLEVIRAHQTMLNTKVTLSNNVNSSIKYDITIYNNSDANYIFTGAYYEKEFYDNENIKFDLVGLEIGDKILNTVNQNSLTFSIKFRYIDDVDFNAEDFSNILNSFIHFNFEREINPVLATNMIPVYYDSENWKKTDITSDNWHDYYNKKWANAVTYDHSLIYNNATNSTELKKFNGTSDYTYLGSESYDFGKNITVMARVKLYETGTYGIVGNVQGGGFYLFKNRANRFAFQFYDNVSKEYKSIVSNFPIELNTWYTVVGTYDGETIKIYVDGILSGYDSVSGSIAVSKAPIVIGGNPNTDGTISGEYFNGAISEVAVMTETLTEEEISNNYGKTIKKIPTEHNALYYVKYDGDNGLACNSDLYEADGMKFDGVDDYVSVGYSEYDFGNTFSIGARFKINSYAQREYGFIGNPQSAGMYLAKANDDKIQFIIYDNNSGSYKNLKSTFVPELDTWYTVVATYNGTTMELYINGKLDNSLNVSIDTKPTLAPFMIGTNSNYSSNFGGGYLDGMISDVILVDEALTANQIETYYSNDLRTIVSNKTLISYDLRSYEFRENGSIIPEEVINTMWTWIPRFSATLPENTGPIDIKMVGTNDEAHDAFNFDGEELEGFWTGKFENGANAVTKDANGNTSNTSIMIKPNLSIIRNKNLNLMFTDIKDISILTDIYGFDSSSNILLDSHLIKNNEWAAIAYFTQSKYGLCTNTTCNQLEANDSNYITGGVNYSSNVGQSTTGNVYGIYDMNGGTDEFTMGNYNSTLNSQDGFSNIPDSKYLNIYDTTDNYLLMNLQHAMIETNNLFNSGTSNFVSLNKSWLSRSNLFSYNSIDGSASDSIGSRSILIVK